jgi:hypothetical protein
MRVSRSWSHYSELRMEPYDLSELASGVSRRIEIGREGE